MAGLLETIAKRLLGGSEPKKAYTNTQRNTTKTAYVKPIVQQTKPEEVVEAWVKNSTIQENESKETVVQAFDRTFKRERTNREVEREDLLLSKDELETLFALRKSMANMSTSEMTEKLIEQIVTTKTNKDFIDRVKLFI